CMSSPRSEPSWPSSFSRARGPSLATRRTCSAGCDRRRQRRDRGGRELAVEKIWKRHWPPGLDEDAIRLPSDPISVILKRNAEAGPAQTALIFYGREVSLGELDESSDRFAGWLRSRGLEPGDRVALYLENCPQFAIAYFGSLEAGGVNVCLNPMHKAGELRHECLDAGVRFLMTSEEGYGVFEPIRKDTQVEAVVVT